MFVLDGWNFLRLRRDERPVQLPLGALLNPLPQQRNFTVAQRRSVVGGRHPRLRIGIADAVHKVGLIDSAWHDRRQTRFALTRRHFAVDERDAAGLLHSAVAGDAMIRKNWADV